jgi:hypothetical protein
MTTARSSRGSSGAAGALALIVIVIGGTKVSAHRQDEFLQAARVAMDSGRVQIELDLTPGIAMAEEIFADIDRNRDGSLSQEEQRAYGSSVLSALELEVDGSPLRMRPGASSFPDLGAMRRGEGIIRLQSAAILPRLSVGSHQLLFRNRHHPVRSVYLANALVPGSDEVAITAQRRDVNQTELTIDYVLRGSPATSTATWLLGGIAAVMMLSAMGIVRSTTASTAAPSPPAVRDPGPARHDSRC